MKTVSGQLTLLGNATRSPNHITYSTIEIDKTNINNLSIGPGLDNYLSTSLGKECTLHINNGSIIGIDTNGKSYIASVPLAVVLFLAMVAGFFGLIFTGLAFANFVDGMFGRKVDYGNIMGGLLFIVLGLFFWRSTYRNIRTGGNLRKLSKRPGVVKV